MKKLISGWVWGSVASALFYGVVSVFVFPSLLVVALASAQTVVAQTHPNGDAGTMPPSAYKLVEVTVTGSKRFTQDEVARASGLPVGTVAHEEDFQKAARQLGESGAFSNITFTYSYSTAGTKLVFQVTDADKFVPVQFADFVWFSEEELRHRLQERIPLFAGEVPTSGRLADEVSDILQAMLVENAVPGQVQYLRNEDKDGKLQSIEYNVTGVSIRIHHADFPGANPAELPLLADAAEKLYGREYSRTYMSNFVEKSVLPVLHGQGYLKASCAAARPKVVKVASSEPLGTDQPPTFVDVTFPVTPGIQYRVSGWKWSGNKVIASNELEPLVHIKTGQVANTVLLSEELRSVQKLYGTRGYILASVRVDAAFDDTTKTVAYILDVSEGAQFHMGELEFRGLDNNLTARLRAAWKIRPGDVFDSSYLDEYLPLAKKLLPPNLDWDVSSHVTAIANEKTVDVDLLYAAKAPR
jgi:outer membrane protein assembly factor BamA